MYKAIKNKSNAWKLLRASVGIVVLIFIGWQIAHFNMASFGKLRHVSPLCLVAAFLLSPLNWWFEFLKLQILARRAGSAADNSALSHAFFAGILSAFLTPNMAGNFVGRIFYFKRQERVPVVVYSLLANGSQWLITFLFGILALSGQCIFELHLPLSVAWILVLMAFIAYFFFEHLIPQKGHRKIRFRRLLSGTIGLRGIFLGISTLRYFVFLGQFALMIRAFYPFLGSEALPAISLLYLFMTFTPGLFFGKIIVRETVAVWLLGLYAIPDAVSLSAAFLIWVANLALPCLLGLAFVKKPVSVS